MTGEETDLQKLVLIRLHRLNTKIQGVVTGIITGLAVFVTTNWLILKGGDVVGPHLALLGNFFIGYEVSFVGSLIGLAYGFLTGFLVGYAVSNMYNWIAERRQSTHKADA
jgi:hypothetical protein